MSEFEQIQEVARKYSKYGVTFMDVQGMIANLPQEYSFRRKLNTARCFLIKQYGEQEYFSIEDTAELLNMTIEEAWDFVKENNIGFRVDVQAQPLQELTRTQEENENRMCPY